jgi:hypothetical protein
LNNNELRAQVTPNPSEILARPHVTNGRCWCKARVPLMANGVKVGEGTIDHTGLFTTSVSSDVLAEMFTGGVIESLSISGKFKDPSVDDVNVVNLSRF